ncbi:hypothetical protein GCM10023231_16560 [Olivibacter ginsenosidimutans]|uniref:DoxX family protein n=2 Tax=Olivibacter ginsenosidimutans TaxID=1176537 RepID=A0ABP9B0Q3_9SPHI
MDNILYRLHMQEFISFLREHQLPYPTLAYLSVYTQFICGCLFIAGYYQRIAALLMIINFIFAILFVHIGDVYANTFPALFMLASSLSLFFSGAGKLSIDYYLQRKGKRNKRYNIR